MNGSSAFAERSDLNVISLKYELADHIQATSSIKIQVSRKAGFERAGPENTLQIITIVVVILCR